MKRLMGLAALMMVLTQGAFAANNTTVNIPSNEETFRVTESREVSVDEVLEDSTVCRRQTVCSSFGGCFQRVMCVPTYRYSDQYEYYPW